RPILQKSARRQASGPAPIVLAEGPSVDPDPPYQRQRTKWSLDYSPRPRTPRPQSTRWEIRLLPHECRTSRHHHLL
ncbi:hypothetical protein F2A37_24965, partial [Pseudomonas chlororaphis]